VTVHSLANCADAAAFVPVRAACPE